MTTQSDSVSELYKSVGALFLAKAKFTANMQVDSSILNYPNAEKEITARLVKNVTGLLVDTFAKQVEHTEVIEGKIYYKLSFFAFTQPEFKLMVEYIISQIPESEILRIRGNKI